MNKLSTLESSPIGAFFTPLQWAKWVVAENKLFERWTEGAVVFDPTAGEGSFLEAFVALAFDRHIPVTIDMARRLAGAEKEKKFARNFFLKMKRLYDVDFPKKNFRCEDYILSKNATNADIVVGNPPWQNFNDLPPLYKETLKPYYFRYHLVPNTQELLLGGSRIDLAALVIAKTANVTGLTTRKSTLAIKLTLEEQRLATAQKAFEKAQAEAERKTACTDLQRHGNYVLYG